MAIVTLVDILMVRQVLILLRKEAAVALQVTVHLLDHRLVPVIVRHRDHLQVVAIAILAILHQVDLLALVAQERLEAADRPVHILHRQDQAEVAAAEVLILHHRDQVALLAVHPQEAHLLEEVEGVHQAEVLHQDQAAEGDNFQFKH
jgi:hypothetical protein